VPTQYTASVNVADFQVNDVSIVYFVYRTLWDRGSADRGTIHDPKCELSRKLENATGNPTPAVEFELEWNPSRDRLYKNRGSKHKLYIKRAGQVTTPFGLCIRIRAVDQGSILLRERVLNHHAIGVRASDFAEALAAAVGIDATIPQTGDVSATHRALRTKPIDGIRYELDRVLSTSGKPISLQFDDRSDVQVLTGYEELYDSATTLLESFSGGTFAYGVGNPANGGGNMQFGTAAYHYEMDQDYGKSIWGHTVSVDHLTTEGDAVVGQIKPRLNGRLGIQGDILTKGERRIHLPAGPTDNPTSDDYFAQAIMTNHVFQSEMGTTRGSIIVDPDFKAFDSTQILNRKHIIVSITGGDNSETKHSIMPNKAVVMGFEHRLNRASGYSRVFIRRGS
jgi:hypothetical protein